MTNMRSFVLFSIILISIPAVLKAGNQEVGQLIARDASCKVWWAGNTYKIKHDDPAPEKRGTVFLQAAQNENEGFQLVMSPQKDIKDISVTVTNFLKKDGALIPAANVTIRNVEYVHVTKPSGKLHKAGWYPDPLPLYEQPLSVKSGINAPVLITVNVPKEAAPGIYSAEINLKSTSWQVSIPVKLQVWNFALPDVPSMRSAFGLYSGMIKQYHNLDNTQELKQVMDQYYRCFRDYRISPQQFYDQYPIRETVKGVWWNGGTFDPDTVFAGNIRTR